MGGVEVGGSRPALSHILLVVMTQKKWKMQSIID